jgi:hypothetical protein
MSFYDHDITIDFKSNDPRTPKCGKQKSSAQQKKQKTQLERKNAERKRTGSRSGERDWKESCGDLRTPKQIQEDEAEHDEAIAYDLSVVAYKLSVREDMEKAKRDFEIELLRERLKHDRFLNTNWDLLLSVKNPEIALICTAIMNMP